MIVVGLALFSTLSAHSVEESEPLPHFDIVKTLLEALAIKQCDRVSGYTFKL